MIEGQQVQIVVAEHGQRAVAEGFHQPQGLQRIRAAIDEIAAKPEGIRGLIEIDFLEQPAKLRIAALNVAYRVNCHRRGLLVEYPRG